MVRAAAARPSCRARCNASTCWKARWPKPSAASAGTTRGGPGRAAPGGGTGPASTSPPRRPPPICAAAAAAIRHLKSSSFERERHQERAARVKAVLNAARLPVMPSATHIVPVLVGEPETCKAASDLLLAEHGIYIQPINYPTVP